jgi:hypothetical protein
MKIRLGFVSNSSSSSFIVGFDTKPQTADELRKLMFPDGQQYVSAYDDPVSTDQVVEAVFADLQSAPEIMSPGELIDEISHGYFPGYPEGGHYEFADEVEQAYKIEFGTNVRDAEKEGRPGWHKRWYAAFQKDNDAFDKVLRAAAENYANTLWPELKGKKLFRFEYEDHTPLGATMEHGDIFKSLSHVRVSHH